MELSERDLMLLSLLAEGEDVAGIAQQLNYSVGWTYSLLRNLRESLDASTDTAAVVEGLRLGVISYPERYEYK